MTARTSCDEHGVLVQRFLPGAPQHHADGRQNLAELVVQVARHLAQGLLLHFNQLPGKHAQLLRLRLQFFRQVVQALEGFAVGLQRVESRAQRHQEQHADQQQNVL